MSRKHFEMLAAFMARQFPLDENFTAASQYWQMLVEKLATELEKTNPRFDRNRFIAACRDV